MARLPQPHASGPPGPALARALAAAKVRLRDRRRELDEVLAEASAVADDEHDPDGSPISLQRTLASALVERAESEVAALTEAVARAASGVYGICETCGDSISRARLAALPAATRCAGCRDNSNRPSLRRR